VRHPEHGESLETIAREVRLSQERSDARRGKKRYDWALLLLVICLSWLVIIGFSFLAVTLW
jgi:hypothetical protein